ncbi:TPA: hypothetical protein N0F65_011721 [Lagenidium giganteum]|uniref:Uncharacterized protein n=1 Tax=Lagenidium giganteum TaxID=4803 RepID=A0AAV2YBK5_9STRA|nr:TPA: hypothetical protein N0F65_011721 [Lagenidium giganteum]
MILHNILNDVKEDVSPAPKSAATSPTSSDEGDRASDRHALAAPPAASDDDRAHLCRYRNKKCMQPRAVKRNGDLHNLCELHRLKANRNQRKLESKRRIQKRVYEETQQVAQLTALYKQPALPPVSSMPFASSMRPVATLPPPAENKLHTLVHAIESRPLPPHQHQMPAAHHFAQPTHRHSHPVHAFQPIQTSMPLPTALRGHVAAPPQRKFMLPPLSKVTGVVLPSVNHGTWSSDNLPAVSATTHGDSRHRH